MLVISYLPFTLFAKTGGGAAGSGRGIDRVAQAVAATLQGCPGTPCLASALRMHNACELWLDPIAASQLHAPSVRLHPKAFPGFVDLQVRLRAPGMSCYFCSCVQHICVQNVKCPACYDVVFVTFVITFLLCFFFPRSFCIIVVFIVSLFLLPYPIVTHLNSFSVNFSHQLIPTGQRVQWCEFCDGHHDF